MSVIRSSFEEFLEKSRQSPDDPLSSFLTDDKTVHVFALTRDLCSGCQMQKPLYEKLADTVGRKHGERVKFHSIHLSNHEGFGDKRQDFRRILRFAAYPTYLILVNDGAGSVEAYRAIEPPMEEIERNISLALELLDR